MMMKTCSKCKCLLSLECFFKRKTGTYYYICKSCVSIKNKAYYLQNKQLRLVQFKNYYELNKLAIIKKNSIHKTIKRQTDIKLKLINNLRRRLSHTLKGTNKSYKTLQMLGCDLNTLKVYLESRFTDNMTWENYGNRGWHIDHIIPLSLAKSKEELYKLCHYSNLQPLWMCDNLKKGNKLNWVNIKITD